MYYRNRSFAIFMKSTPWASSAMASLLPPTPGRRPFRGNALVAPVMGNSSPARFDQIHPGGRSTQLSPGRFEGIVAATTWGNRHGLYRRPHLKDARSGATRLYGGGGDGESGDGGGNGDDEDNGGDSDGGGHTTINRVRGRWHQTRR